MSDDAISRGHRLINDPERMARIRARLTGRIETPGGARESLATFRASDMRHGVAFTGCSGRHRETLRRHDETA